MSESELRTALALTAQVAEKALERLQAADRVVKMARPYMHTDADLLDAIEAYDRLAPKTLDHS